MKISTTNQEMKADFNATFASAEGRRTLHRIMHLCGYQSQSVVADPESREIQINSTVYNEGRRNLYLSIRSLLRRDILVDVENSIESFQAHPKKAKP